MGKFAHIKKYTEAVAAEELPPAPEPESSDEDSSEESDVETTVFY